MAESAPDPAAAAAAAESKAEERQIELAEQNAKLAEKLESTAQAVAGIAERVAHQPAPAAPQHAPQVRVTEEQVAAAVERGEITQSQGMQILSRQYREDAKNEARRETQAAFSELGSAATQQHVSNLIGEYKQHVPGLGQRGSAEWNEAAQRFHALVREGYPSTIATELQALREIHGRDPSKAGGADPVRERTKERATRGQETASSASARAPARSRRTSSEPDPDLASEHRSYVQRMIQIGQYKGWDDPRAQKYVERAKSIASSRGR